MCLVFALGKICPPPPISPPSPLAPQLPPPYPQAVARSAQLEFRVGSAERGRGVYEVVLRKTNPNPNRYSTWSTYEKQHGDAASTAHAKKLAMEFVKNSNN